MKTEYVLGFAFNESGKDVVLIVKKRPEWQAGQLNGVGGHVEESDLNNFEAMIREFREETGVETTRWEYRFDYIWPKAVVNIYSLFDDDIFERAETVTDESIVKPRACDLPGAVIPNLRWMIPLLLDKTFTNGSIYADDAKIEGRNL